MSSKGTNAMQKLELALALAALVGAAGIVTIDIARGADLWLLVDGYLVGFSVIHGIDLLRQRAELK